MFFAIPLSSLASFFIVLLGKDEISPETVFQVASILTATNLILLYLFDDKEMLLRKKK